MTDGELNTDKPGSAADIKAKIDAMKKGDTSAPIVAAKPAVEEAAIPAQGSAQSTPEKAPQPTAETQAAPVQTGQADDQPVAPTDKKEGKPEVDIREWAKRKGIKDEESALKSLRELERKLSQSNAKKTPEPGVIQFPAQQWQPTPQYQPQQPYYPPPPQYPQYPPVNRNQIIQEEAARRGWDPNDFEKVLSLATEISEINTRKVAAQLKTEYDGRLSEIDKENRRNTEMRELMQDPLFTNQDVQFEMHKVLEENPKALELEPTPRIWAFQQAQIRLARRYLQDQQSGSEDSGQTKNLPTKPPTEASRGQASFEAPSEAALLEQFNKGSAAEMRAVLNRIGARPTL